MEDKEEKDDIKKKHMYKVLLIFLILLLVGVNYPFLDRAIKTWASNYEIGIVERIIDGDTIVVNGSTVRLLGINAPEKGERYYDEAKNFLEEQALNRIVRLEFGPEDRDRYDRKLRYVVLNNKNVNLNLVKIGLANFYFPTLGGKNKYYRDFKKAWEECVESNQGICKKSTDSCAPCIEIKSFNYKNQEVVFRNTCPFYCELEGWSIKDEGRKKFVFPSIVLEKELTVRVGEEEDTINTLYWKNESYVWTQTGDTLFLRDSYDRLVLWKSY
ncbi:MAG: thermonuclease family protein [Nanoarchaeota archaeon]|nr:thermonuclease family protein [Nanoarchaeota archaeon]